MNKNQLLTGFFDGGKSDIKIVGCTVQPLTPEECKELLNGGPSKFFDKLAKIRKKKKKKGQDNT